MGKRTTLEWAEMQSRQEKAIERTAEVLGVLKIASAPINPLGIAESEEPLLRVAGGDFRNRFDGQFRVPLGQFARRKSLHRRQFRLDVHARRPFLRLSRVITARTSGHRGPRGVAGAKAIPGGTRRFLGGGACGSPDHVAVAKDAPG